MKKLVVFLLTLPMLISSIATSAQCYPDGNALSFSGGISSGSKVTFTGSTFDFATFPVTIEAWIFYTGTANIQTIVSTSNDGGGGQGGYALLVNAWNTTNRRLILQTKGAALETSTDNAIPLNTWTHVAAVITSSTSANLYVNGVQQTTTGSVLYQASGLPFCIGALQSAFYNFNGKIDELRIWNTDRSSLIASTYNAAVATNSSGLIGYFKMNQGTADGNNTSITTLTNSASSGVNGTLSGFSLTGSSSNFTTSASSATVTGTSSVNVGSTTQLTGSGTPASSNPWVSSNTGVATVNSSGLVTGVSAGTSTITYTTNGGCTGSVTVTVSVPGSSCNHSVVLSDTYGDGWNGGTITITTGGNSYGPYTLASGFGPQSYTFSAAHGAAISISYIGSGWPYENYYQVLDGTGASLVSNYYPNTSGTWNGTANCGASSPPTITISGTLSAFTKCSGSTSTAQSFSVSGTALTAGISINPPAGFEVSTSSTFASGVGTNGAPITVGAAGTVATTTIYVRMQSSANNATYSAANIVCSSSGATSQNVSCQGTTTTAPTITATTPNSRCGAGTVTLGATASAGTVNWYTASTGGTAVSTGNSYTTPSISATTTYFVDATNSGCTTSTRTAVVATVNSAASISGSSTVAVGSTISLTGSGSPATSNPWISSALAVATVNSAGVVTGLSAGNSTITYTTSTGCTATLMVTSSYVIPIITSFAPSSGAVGASVTLTGLNFNSTASNNFVTMGGVKLAVTAASATSLTVTIPAGAQYGPFQVTDLASGRMGRSKTNFLVTNANTSSISTLGAQSFASAVNTNTIASGALGTLGKGTTFGSADIDGDGFQDVVIGGSSNIAIHRNTSTSGSLSFAANVNVATGSTSFIPELAIEDLNGDGKKDIVIVTGDASNSIKVFKNTSTPGSISFDAFLTINTAYMSRLKLGDADADGFVDIFAAGGYASSVNIVKNTSTLSTLSFGSSASVGGFNGMRRLSLADVNKDGFLDIVGGNGSSTVVSTACASCASISYSSPVVLTGGPYYMSAVQGDFNSDGKNDIMVQTECNGGIFIGLNNNTSGTISAGDFSFSNIQSTCYGYMEVGDLNGDAKLDYVEGAGGSYIGARLNTWTSGTYSSSSFQGSSLNLGNAPQGMLICDFDNDNKPDVLSRGEGGSTFSVFRNTISERIFISGTLSPFTPCSGTVSTAQTVSVSGSGLTTGIVFNAFTGIEYSTNGSTFSSTLTLGSTGDLAATTVYIRTTASASNISGNISVTTTGDSKTLAVSGTPIVVTTNISGNAIICSGSSTTLTASGASTYVWNTGATTASISVSPTTNTVYTVTGTNVNGCSDAESISVTVYALPAVSISGSSSVCLGSSTTLTATGGNSYVWGNSTTGSTLTVSPNVQTTYSVTGTGNTGCTYTATYTVDILSAPSISAQSTAAQTVCQNATATALSVTATGSGLTYQWYSNTTASTTGGTSISGATSSSYTPSTSALGTTYYYCVVSGTCSPSATSDVSGAIAVSGPLAGTIAVTGSSTVCPGSSVDLTLSGHSGSIQWQSSSSLNGTYTDISGSTSPTFNTGALSSSTYFRAKVTSGSCSAVYATAVSITVSSVNIQISGDPTICGSATTLTASGATSYSWYVGPYQVQDGINGNTATLSPVETTTYTVNGTNANGCTGSTNVTVTVILPVLQIGPSGSICAGQPQHLISNIMSSTGVSYLWSNGSTSSSITVYPVATNNTYTLTATAGGCTSTASANVTVIAGPSLTISSSTTICAGASTTLVASGADNYSWNNNAGSSATVTVSPTATTTYTVTGSNTQCSSTASVTVTVNTPIYSYNNSGTWGTASNWNVSCDNGVTYSLASSEPTTPSIAYVNNGQTVSVSNLTVASGNQVIVKTGGKLTVDGGIVNNGIVKIESGGSLVQTGTTANSGSGTYIAERQMSGAGSDTPTGRFWYTGVPLTGAISSGFLAGGPNKLWIHNEATGGYTEITDDATNLTLAKGYVFRGVNNANSNNTYSFSSNSIGNGSVPINVTRTANSTKPGFNLVANPYPSHLNFDALYNSTLVNQVSPLLPTVWYRTATVGGLMLFDTYNTVSNVGTNLSGVAVTKMIAPFQSFWVRVAPGSTSVTMTATNEMRFHDNQNFLTITPALVRLNLSNGTFHDQAIVVLNEDLSNDYDYRDSDKEIPSATVHQIYSLEGTKKVVINGIANAITKDTLQLGVQIPTAGTYSINCSELTFSDLVYLEDKLTDAYVLLDNTSNYSFTSVAGTIHNRFVLHFVPNVPGQTAATAIPMSTSNWPQCNNVSTADQWHAFTATSEAVSIAVNTTTADITIELQDGTGNVVAQENAVNGIGNETLNFFGLAAGQTYKVGVRNANLSQGTGTYGICVRSLKRGGCDYGAGPYSLCQYYKATWAGSTGVSYTFTFTGTSGPAQGQTFTRTQNSDICVLSTVTPLLPYGSTYDVTISNTYTLTDGAGNTEQITVPSNSGCQVVTIAQPQTTLSANSSCNNGPRFRGAIVSSMPWVCGANNWRWRFTEVNPLTLQAVGLPIELNRGAASNFMSLGTVNQLQNGKTYAVQTAPLFTYTGTNYQWGPVQYMCIVGAAGMTFEGADAAQGAEQGSTKDVAQDAPQVEAVVYVTEGNHLNIQLTNAESNAAKRADIYDVTGKLVKSVRLVEGMNTLAIDDASGIYMVRTTVGEKVETQRVFLKK